jgi:predicted amidohydrolase
MGGKNLFSGKQHDHRRSIKRPIRNDRQPPSGGDFMGHQLHFALLQFAVEAGHEEANIAAARRMMERAMEEGEARPDVIVLPELWNTGYCGARFPALADEDGKRTLEMMSEFCRRHRVNVVAGSIAMRLGSSVTNTSLVIDRSGELTASYSKIHLFRLMDEHLHLSAGDSTGMLALDGIPAGLIICYDLRFPELARKLALGGAKLLIVPAQWPHPRLEHWRVLLRARAIENQMAVIACNRVGTSGAEQFFGHSMVIGPWGDIVAEGGEGEEVVRASIDLDDVARARRTIPVFEDRRPELY